MTCPLYSVFHVVLSTQSLPACRATPNHTSLGAVALTAPRSLLGFSFRKGAATCARESATALRCAHCSAFCQDVPREVNHAAGAQFAHEPITRRESFRQLGWSSRM